MLEYVSTSSSREGLVKTVQQFRTLPKSVPHRSWQTTQPKTIRTATDLITPSCPQSSLLRALLIIARLSYAILCTENTAFDCHHMQSVLPFYIFHFPFNPDSLHFIIHTYRWVHVYSAEDWQQRQYHDPSTRTMATLLPSLFCIFSPSTLPTPSHSPSLSHLSLPDYTHSRSCWQSRPLPRAPGSLSC